MNTLKLPRTALFAAALAFSQTSLIEAQDLGELDPNLVKAFEAGKAAMADENWEEALVAFEEATKFDQPPTFAELYFNIGEALREREDYKNAIDNYRLAISIENNYAQAHNGLGVCYREQTQYDVALSSFQNAEQFDRRDPSIAANLGDIYINIFRQASEGLPYLDRAIELDPENAEAYRNRGFGHLQLKEYEESIADLNKAAELDPKDYKIYELLAAAHQIEEDYTESIDAIGKAIQAYEPEDSGDPDAYISGYLSRALQRFTLAKEGDRSQQERDELYELIVADTEFVLEEFPDRFPDAGTAQFRKGLAKRMQGLFAEAITAFTDSLQIIPAGQTASYAGEAYLYRGICWFYQGQTSLARGDFKEAAAQNFADPLPHLWIGFTQAKDGDYRRAIESYGEAAAKSPNFSLAYVNRGLAYMQLKDYEKAGDNFNRAIRAEPTEPSHYYKSGRAHEAQGRWQEALAFYNLALQRNSEYEDARSGAARSLQALGRSNLSEIQENL